MPNESLKVLALLNRVLLYYYGGMNNDLDTDELGALQSIAILNCQLRSVAMLQFYGGRRIVNWILTAANEGMVLVGA